MLLRKQRNDLYKILVSRNLNANDFTEILNDTEYALERNASKFWFHIKEGSEYSKIQFSPKIRMSDVDSRTGVTWEEATAYFTQWADILNKEYNTPDLWEEAKANSKLFALNE